MIGDFNNFAKAQDRIDGKMVIEVEYENLQNTMTTTGLCEMDNISDYFTWSNKQVIDTIYSRIDKLLSNLEWFQENMNTILNIPPNISNHALLHVFSKCIERKPKGTFPIQ